MRPLSQSQLFDAVLPAPDLARRGYDIAMDAVAGLTYLHDLNCAHLVLPWADFPQIAFQGPGAKGS